jgi:hypothetical protein
MSETGAVQAGGPEEPVKDEDAAHPIAAGWRPTFREIISAFVDGDYALARGVSSVAEVSAATARQIAEYIADYGETLAPLPDDTWTTSVAQWTGTDHWDVLVDLWTVESGASDLVLGARVFETDDGFRIEIGLVYVP